MRFGLYVNKPVRFLRCIIDTLDGEHEVTTVGVVHAVNDDGSVDVEVYDPFGRYIVPSVSLDMVR